MAGKIHFKRGAHWALAGLAVVSASACSGGGGGSGPTTGAVAPVSPPPPPPTPSYPSATSSEYLSNWAIADVKASAAWQRGATGQGITVAVIDSGAQASHPEIAGAIRSDSKDMDSARNQLFSTTDTHGSELAALIAGQFNGSSTVGVAFNAQILALRADNGSGNFPSATLAAALDYARVQGAKVVNLSLGGSTPLGATFEQALQRATAAGMIVVASAGNEGGVATESEYPARYAINAALSNGLIIVSGAHGKNGQITSFSSPAGSAQNFYLTAAGDEIIVPDFGNPGPTDPLFQVCTAGVSCRVQGTSYSSPITAGAVALLLSAFPGLTPQQVVDLLLTSTDDIGAVGIDPITGHGRLNLTKAFAPVGTVSAPLSGGSSFSASDGIVGSSSAAIGDAFANAQADLNVAGFDALGRTYMINLGAHFAAAPRASIADAPDLWRSTDARSDASNSSFGEKTLGYKAAYSFVDDSAPSSMRLAFGDEKRANTRFLVTSQLSESLQATASSGAQSFSDISPGETFGHMELAGADFGLRFSQNLGGGFSLSAISQSSSREFAYGLESSDRRVGALRLQHREYLPQALGARRLDWALLAGVLHDNGSILDMSWSNSLGGAPKSRTDFVSASAGLDLTRGLRLGARAEWGQTNLAENSSPFSATALETSAYLLGLRYSLEPAAGSWVSRLWPEGRSALSFSVSQPLRVENGSLMALLPSADSYGRSSLHYEQRVISLSPSGREIDLKIAYELWAGEALSARAEIQEALEPGHIATADPETIANVGFRWAF